MRKLSANYASIYNHLLKSVGTDLSVKPDAQVAFWPVRGHQYDGDLLVIGRFTNGWHTSWTKQDMASEYSRQQLLVQVRGYSESAKHCPMSWIANRPIDQEYNPKRSHFWNVIKDVSLEGIQNKQRLTNWSSWICWSNLYKVVPPKPPERKIAPQPSALSKHIQLPDSVRLIKQELEEFCPRRILVLTGHEMFRPFAQALGLKMNWRKGYVEGTAAETNRQWVVAQHPQGKPKAAFVEEVLEAFTI